MQKSDPPKLTQKDVTNLINWKVECFNHIRWLERANWNGMTFIGPFTIAIIGFLAYYSFRLELPPQNDGKLYYSYAIIFIFGGILIILPSTIYFILFLLKKVDNSTLSVGVIISKLMIIIFIPLFVLHSILYILF